MSYRISSFGLVRTSTLAGFVCPVTTNLVTSVTVPTTLTTSISVPTLLVDTLTIPTNLKDCDVATPYGRTNRDDIYVPQGANRTLAFTDSGDTTDFTGLSAVTFDVWDSISAGSTNQISKSLSSGVTVASETIINVSLLGTDTNITQGAYHYEIWVNDGSVRYLLKYGSFIVEDTRKHDA